VVERIKELTAPDNGVHTLIEATGIAQVAYDMLPAIGYQGEIIFLGTPRGEAQGNLADVFCYSHLDERGSITFKGAHEWRYPVGVNKFVKHSFERNTQIALELITQGKLHVENMVSHIITPDKAGETYLSMSKNMDDYLGVVIDWTKTI
jgi:threonine dehydrogenase-like Zn-dependent dehydrogenase